MNEELTVLAEAGAAAVVTAMATDLWQGARDTVLGLFRRDERGHRAAIEAQLDGNAALVREAEAPDDVRRTLFGLWTLELEALLRRDPSCLDPLARLAAGIDAALPDGRGDFLREHLEQTNTAHDFGTVVAVQRGDLHQGGTSGRDPFRSP